MLGPTNVKFVQENAVTDSYLLILEPFVNFKLFIH